MISVFAGPTADNVWRQLVDAFRERRGVHLQSGRGGLTNEILRVATSIEDPRQRWVTSRTPTLNIAFALAEVIWIVAGRRDLDFIQYWNKGISKFVGSGPEVHGGYGYRLRRHLGIDQLKRAHSALAQNPDSRQVVLQMWDSRIDLAQEDGTPSAPDIPCNVISMIKVRDRKLEWSQVLRSHDFFLGMPYNFVQFTSLHEIMAGWLGIDCGSFNQFSDSLHVYKRDMGKVRSSCGPLEVIPNTDCIGLPEDDSTRAFREVERCVELLIDRTKAAKNICSVHKCADVPESYRNILTVLVAEALRKRGQAHAAKDVMSTCSNRLYEHIWSRWHTRVSATHH